MLRGEFFAETHVSTENAPPPQNARLSRAHEEQRRPQGPGSAAQKGTPSSYAHLEIRISLPPARRSRRTLAVNPTGRVGQDSLGKVFRAPFASSSARNTKPSTEQASAARALSSQFSTACSQRFGTRFPRGSLLAKTRKRRVRTRL